MIDKTENFLKNNKRLSPKKVKALIKLLKDRGVVSNTCITVPKIKPAQKEFKPVNSDFLNKNFVQI